MLVSELFGAIWWKISVESCTADFELIDDIADEGVVFGVLEHGLGVFDGLFVHDLWPAAPAPALVGGFECAFRRKAATVSDPKRPPIPI